MRGFSRRGLVVGPIVGALLGQRRSGGCCAYHGCQTVVWRRGRGRGEGGEREGREEGRRGGGGEGKRGRSRMKKIRSKGHSYILSC